MTRYVTHTVHDGIAQVRLARPDKLNAITLETIDQLIETAHQLRYNKNLRAIIVSGDGGSFSAGLDFGAVLQHPVGVVTRFLPRPWRGTNQFQESCWVWRRLPVPVIAAVEGHCLGAGLQLALAADFRVTTPDADWSVLEARWGLVPDMSGIQSLSELVGIDVAKELTMTGRIFSGATAHQLGLATKVSPTPMSTALELAQEIATRSPDSVAATKRMFTRSWNRPWRYTFWQERAEQLLLLAAANTKHARQAALTQTAPDYGPRVLP